jgi:hypothetical protein
MNDAQREPIHPTPPQRQPVSNKQAGLFPLIQYELAIEPRTGSFSRASSIAQTLKDSYVSLLNRFAHQSRKKVPSKRPLNYTMV